MDDAGIVRARDGARHVLHHSRNLREAQSPLAFQPCRERLFLQQLHRKVRRLLVDAAVQDLHDMGAA